MVAEEPEELLEMVVEAEVQDFELVVELAEVLKQNPMAHVAPQLTPLPLLVEVKELEQFAIVELLGEVEMVATLVVATISPLATMVVAWAVEL